MTQIKSKDIKLIDTDKVIVNPKNRNTHSKKQIEVLSTLIKARGFRNPLIVSKRSGFLVAGHGRLEAAKKLGLEKLPVMYQDFESEADEYAFMISDNEIARHATLDTESMLSDLDELDFKLEEFDFEELGLIDFELPSLLNNSDKEDTIPDNNNNSIVTRNGDIWVLGKHLLMCGDSTVIDNVQKLLQGKKVDLVFTDPMYDDTCNKIEAFCSILSSIDVDHILLMTTFKQAVQILKNKFKFRFDLVLNQLVPSSTMNKKVPYYLHKNIIYVTKKEETIFNCDNAKGVFSEAGYYPSVIESAKNTKNSHGLAKNDEGIIKILSGFKAKTIVDFFAGGGSTLIACEKTKRACLSMEIEEKYCDIIIKRWQDYTGRELYV